MVLGGLKSAVEIGMRGSLAVGESLELEGSSDWEDVLEKCMCMVATRVGRIDLWEVRFVRFSWMVNLSVDVCIFRKEGVVE